MYRREPVRRATHFLDRALTDRGVAGRAPYAMRRWCAQSAAFPPSAAVLSRARHTMVLNAKTLTVAPESPGLDEAGAFWIRTASGPGLGFGHLGRSLVLAEALADWRHPLFLISPEDRWSQERLTARGLDFASESVCDIWARRPPPVAVLVDIRGADDLHGLLAGAKERGIPVISIHDLGLELIPSDMVVDGSIAPLPGDCFPSTTVYCAGPEYMVLDPVYRALNRRKRRRPGAIRSVFLNFGGGDSRMHFSRVLEGIQRWGRNVEVYAVRGFTEWGQERLARCFDSTHFHWVSSGIEQHLFAADLAIVAGGISLYEALCAGTPTMALSHDALQQTTIDRLAGEDACMNLGPGAGVIPEALSRLLSDVEADPGRRRRFAARGRKIVDGRGVERVGEMIRRTAASFAKRRN